MLVNKQNTSVVPSLADNENVKKVRKPFTTPIGKVYEEANRLKMVLEGAKKQRNVYQTVVRHTATQNYGGNPLGSQALGLVVKEVLKGQRYDLQRILEENNNTKKGITNDVYLFNVAEGLNNLGSLAVYGPLDETSAWGNKGDMLYHYIETVWDTDTMNVVYYHSTVRKVHPKESLRGLKGLFKLNVVEKRSDGLSLVEKENIENP